jgi:hypothetical protein
LSVTTDSHYPGEVPNDVGDEIELWRVVLTLAAMRASEETS